MNAGKSKGTRWLAPLVWLALVASLLAAVPGAAQAQTDAGDDPLATMPAIVSAGPGGDNPYTSILVEWEWAFPDDPNDPVDSEDDHDYRFDVQIAPDEDGSPGNWSDRGSDAALSVSLSTEADPATGAQRVVLAGRLEHGGLQPGDAFHYRVRARDLRTEGLWATVGPASTKSLPATPTPTEFTAVPAPDSPQNRILFNWDAVSAAGASSVYYRIGMRVSGSEAWEWVDNIGATTYEHSVATPFRFDTYELRAVRDYGDLGTAVSEAATAEVAPSRPPAPSGVTSSPASSDPSGTVTISWTAVSDEAGSVVFYELRYRQDSEEAGWEPLVPGWTESTSYSHRWRAPSATYQYQVRAAREGHSTTLYSDWSESTTVTTSAAYGGL